MSKKTNSVLCPACDEKISVPKKVSLGLRITCHNCTELLEVTSVKPIKLDWADDTDEDDYDYEDDDYEYDSDDEDEQDNKRSNYWS